MQSSLPCLHTTASWKLPLQTSSEPLSFSEKAVVLSVVHNEVDVMPPHIFAVLRVNVDGYVDVFATVVEPWIESVPKGRPYICQKDLVPVHTACVTQ